MSGSNFMHAWAVLVESLAMIALILTAFGIILGVVKPADAMGRVGTIMGIVIILIFIPGVLVSAWSGMSLWQRLGLAILGIAVWQWWWLRRQSHRKNRD